MVDRSDKEEVTFKRVIIGFIIIAIIPFVSVYYIYLSHFNGDLSAEHADWGAMGSFVGGTLGPVYAFLALIALLYTITLQLKELKMTREELRATKEELKRSATAQEDTHKSMMLQSMLMQKQGEIVKQQQFETTFFNLLAMHEKALKPLMKIDFSSEYNTNRLEYLRWSTLEHAPDIEVARDLLGMSDDLRKIQCLKVLKEYEKVLFNILKFIVSNCHKTNNHNDDIHIGLSELISNQPSMSEIFYSDLVKISLDSILMDLLYIQYYEDSTDFTNMLKRFEFFKDVDL